MNQKRYAVSEIFYSIQGEGRRAGVPSVFLRLAGCNMACRRAAQGFDCDTDFTKRASLDGPDLLHTVLMLAPSCRSLVVTGGEPTLQIDSDLLKLFKDSGYFVALETNGTGALPYGVDYVALSPKRNSPPIVLTAADEVRFTLARGQRPFALPFIPKYVCLSPAFRGLELDAAAVEWCIALVKEHPTWTLSVQLHKLLRIP